MLRTPSAVCQQLPRQPLRLDASHGLRPHIHPAPPHHITSRSLNGSRSVDKKKKACKVSPPIRQLAKDGYVACGCAEASHSEGRCNGFFAIGNRAVSLSENARPNGGNLSKGSLFEVLILATFCSENLTEARVIRLFRLFDRRALIFSLFPLTSYSNAGTSLSIQLKGTRFGLRLNVLRKLSV